MIVLLRKNKGITLVALIITVIVMIILAGVAIHLTIGKNGIFSSSRQVVESYKMASAKEKIELSISSYQMNQENTTLIDELKKIEGFSSIHTQDDNRLPYKVVVDGYEFVINEDLSISDQETPKEDCEEGSILASIQTKDVKQNQVLLTIRGESQGLPIEKMDLYVAGQIVKTYQYNDNKLEQEEIFTLSNMEFYQDLECYVVVTNTAKNTATSPSKIVKNIDTIESQVDLKNLATLVNSGNSFSGKTIYLISDIITGTNWIPIGYYDGKDFFTGMPFCGTFEGNHHTITISSLSKSDIYKSSGLFGLIIDGAVNNLKIAGHMDAPCAHVGGIAGGIKNTTISNCSNINNMTSFPSTYDSNYNYHGGIVGFATSSSLLQCSNTDFIAGNTFVGGICGYAETNVKISNCTNSGSASCSGTSNISWANGASNSYGTVGGICGFLLNSKNNYGIIGCINTGNLIYNSNTVFTVKGGIVGWAKNSSILQSKNEGTIITAYSSAIGGIAGALTTNSVLDQCCNVNTIQSTPSGCVNTGGIVGYMSDSTLKNTYNTAHIKGSTNVGGLVGSIESLDSRSYIYNSYNASSSILGDSNVGNVFGSSTSTNGSYIFWISSQVPVGFDKGNTWTDSAEYTLTQMKQTDSGFFTLLTKGSGNGFWQQNSSTNGGLPYLKYSPNK